MVWRMPWRPTPFGALQPLISKCIQVLCLLLCLQHGRGRRRQCMSPLQTRVWQPWQGHSFVIFALEWQIQANITNLYPFSRARWHKSSCPVFVRMPQTRKTLRFCEWRVQARYVSSAFTFKGGRSTCPSKKWPRTWPSTNLSVTSRLADCAIVLFNSNISSIATQIWFN